MNNRALRLIVFLVLSTLLLSSFKPKCDKLSIDDFKTFLGLKYGNDDVKEDSVEKDVRKIVYYSDNDKIALTLKFYPSQGNKLSSICLDWFYDLEKEKK